MVVKHLITNPLIEKIGKGRNSSNPNLKGGERVAKVFMDICLSRFWNESPFFLRWDACGVSSQSHATVLVDGRRSVELVRAELALSIAAHAARGVEVPYASCGCIQNPNT